LSGAVTRRRLLLTTHQRGEILGDRVISSIEKTFFPENKIKATVGFRAVGLLNSFSQLEADLLKRLVAGPVVN